MRKWWLLNGGSHRLYAADGGDAGGGGGGNQDGGGNGAGNGGDGAGAGGGGAGGGSGDGANGGAGDGNGNGGDGAGADGKPASGAGLMDLAGKGGEGQEGGEKGGEGKPAAAKAPANTPPQFLNQDGSLNTEALLKSHGDLRSELSRKPGRPPEKPEAFKLEVASDKLKAANITAFDEADPVLKVARNAFHKAGISNDQANIIANAIMEHAVETGEILDPTAAVQAEFSKLGTKAEAQAIVDGIAGWGEGLKTMGVLSAEELQEFKYMAGTALGAKVMLKLRELTGEQPIPRGGTIVGDSVSAEEAYQMMYKTDKDGNQLYGRDAEWTRKTDEAFVKVFGTGQAGTSPSGLGVRPMG